MTTTTTANNGGMEERTSIEIIIVMIVKNIQKLTKKIGPSSALYFPKLSNFEK